MRPSLQRQFAQLLSQLGSSSITPSAYDTGWLARLGELDRKLSDPALAWLREHQLDDGSWGTPGFVYHHERLICTLSAMVALARSGHDADKARLARGSAAVIAAEARLGNDCAGATIGFELIVPTLLHEARALELPGLGATRGVLADLEARRAHKLARLPEGVVNRSVTLAHSAEMLGGDALSLLDVGNLQEANGSVGYSPAATAFYATSVRRGDSRALAYLRAVARDGAVPYCAPIDVFELGWGLWNLALTAVKAADLLELCQPHLQFMRERWDGARGTAACAGLTLRDGDTSAIVYDVLTHYGHEVSVEGVLGYEVAEHFQCFALESNASVSTNVHVLGALRAAGYATNHPRVQKVLRFLRATRKDGAVWFDKWHASPYYTTAHAVIGCLQYDRELAADAVRWLVRTQREDGSWGYFLSTAEETAYALQALTVWGRAGNAVSRQVTERGAAWLAEHAEPPYPPLWIGKSLYTPNLVVRSAILSALMLAAPE
jgi:halimadienyl-diphosphate synthase